MLEMPPLPTQEEEEVVAVKKTRAIPLLDAYGVPLDKSATGGAAGTKGGMKKGKVTSELHQKIRVCVRKRPLNKKELGKGETDVIQLKSSRSLVLNEPR